MNCNRLSDTTPTDAPPDGRRPLISFCLFSYNQEQFIRKAIEGALSQTYSPLELILSDDCSSDGTFAIMQEIAATYKGPHKIILNRNSTNLGFVQHVNRVCGELAKGELIVMAAGDDVSFPNRTRCLAEAWVENGRPGGVWSSFEEIDSTGMRIPEQSCLNIFSKERNTPDNKAERLRGFAETDSFKVPGCSAAWSRKLFELFNILPRGAFCEDTALAFRAHLTDGVVYVPDCLMAYRRHSQNMSGRFSEQSSYTFATFLYDINKAIDIEKRYLLNLQGYRDDLRTAVAQGFVAPDTAEPLDETLSSRYKSLSIKCGWSEMGWGERAGSIKYLINKIGWKNAVTWSIKQVLKDKRFLFIKYQYIKGRMTMSR